MNTQQLTKTITKNLFELATDSHLLRDTINCLGVGEDDVDSETSLYAPTFAVAIEAMYLGLIPMVFAHEVDRSSNEWEFPASNHFLNAAYLFLTGQEPYPENAEYTELDDLRGKYFEELPEDVQKEFKSREVAVQLICEVGKTRRATEQERRMVSLLSDTMYNMKENGLL